MLRGTKVKQTWRELLSLSGTQRNSAAIYTIKHCQYCENMADKYSKETTEEFSSRLFSIISGGFTSLSIALGFKSGLFDVLVDQHDKPMTSQELADAAGLKERYVREWLGAMTTAHVVDLDPATEKYHLPVHRVDCFRSGTLPGQSVKLSLGVPISSTVFNDMLQVVKEDGPRGLTSAQTQSYTEFNENYSLAWYNHCLIQEFIPSQPEIEAKLESGIRMLDVGCGRGAAVKILAKRFPNSHFVGLDLEPSNVDLANKEAARLGLENLEFLCVDGSAMPEDWTSTFDYVFFFNLLHDAPRPDLILDDVKRVMKKDGIISVFEFNIESKLADNVGKHFAPFVYTISLFYCLPMSYNYPDSLGLGTAWGKDRVAEFLEKKGFAVKSVTETPKIPQVHFLCELK